MVVGAAAGRCNTFCSNACDAWASPCFGFCKVPLRPQLADGQDWVCSHALEKIHRLVKIVGLEQGA